MSELGRTERAALAAIALSTVLAGIARYAHGVSQVLAFALATLALAGQAWIVSFATEQVGRRLGPAITGLMQSTVGNLPEFFVVIFALGAGQRIVAETAILGSILVNALLVLGLVIVAGARRAGDHVMRFSPRLPNDTATLLLVSTFIIVLIGLANSAHDTASHHTQTISIVGAVAILVVYASWLRQYLRPDGNPVPRAEQPRAEQPRAEQQRAEQPSAHQADAPDPDAEQPSAHQADARDPDAEQPRLPARISIALLAIAGTASAFVSDWFVHALQPTIQTLHISQAFAGLVIVAIAGNAVENVAGIVLAAKGRSELAISVVKNSVAQIAAFLYPLLVLVSLLTATTLTFSLAPVYIGALFGSALIVWQITGDGEATVFEGAALIATFVILATVAAFET
ncbi:MAG: sodium:proton exchanger [Actinomycetota bacterium]|nr:sodium:proton exchanger [Actinomycetota bacterium]